MRSAKGAWDGRFGDRRGCAHPDREVRRGIEGPAGGLARRPRDPPRPPALRVGPRPGRLRDHGAGHPGRGRADHGTPGGDPGGDPQGGPRDHDQQGLPVRAERDRARGPAHPCGRGRGRRRGRHGVDVAGALPHPRRPVGPADGERRDRRFDDLRRPVVHVHRQAHGRHLGRGQHRARDHARGAGRMVGAVTPSRCGRVATAASR